MKRISRIQTTQVRLTEQQEQRLAKLYSILDMINPAESNQQQADNDNEKTMIIAEANPNF